VGDPVPLITATSVLADATERTGVLAAALLAAAAILAREPRRRALAIAGALVLTPVLLVVHIWDTPQLRPLRDRPVLAIGLVLAALAGVALLALVLRRRPALLAPVAVAVLPFRIPIASGGETANLLVPLYLVIAAGALAYAVPRLRRTERESPEGGRRWVEVLLVGLVVLYAAQATYSSDFSKALEQVVFFYVPFAVLFALLRRVQWTPAVVRNCFLVLVALALAFVAIGYVEYARKELLLNPRVINSNQFESYFRVNSLFFDPNIYGRFLVVVMLGLVASLLWSGRTREAVVGALVLVALWGGLVLSFSQSSIAALLVGLAVLGALRWSVRRAVAAAGAAVAAGAAFVVLAPGAVHLDLGSSRSADRATSGRVELIEGGVRLFADRPATGWGAGAFEREYRRRESASRTRAVAASHTIPVTFAAEQGVAGLALYLALLVAAFVRLLRGAATSAVRAFAAAAFLALVAHTMLYAAFLEDPLAWALLALGTAATVPTGGE
jgi:O-antigen ligase